MIDMYVQKTIADLDYRRRTTPDGQQQDILYVTFADGETTEVPNGDFTVDNPTLQLLGYIEVPPSRVGGYDGNAQILVDPHLAIAQEALRHGKLQLCAANWGPNRS